MKKKISTALVALFLVLLCTTTITEAMPLSNTLNSKQKGIVTIAAFTANGDLKSLKIALGEGLEAGLTVNEIKEILVQLYAYCGFPRSLNAVNTFMDVMEERKSKGIQDEFGPEAQAISPNINKNEYGMLVRQKLVGRTTEAPPSGYQLFTPVLDNFLKEHLFADIFYRDNLNYLSREIATVSALGSMSGTNPQLQSHMSIALRAGLSENQMIDLISIISSRVSKIQGDNASSVYNKLVDDKSRGK